MDSKSGGREGQTWRDSDRDEGITQECIDASTEPSMRFRRNFKLMSTLLSASVDGGC